MISEKIISWLENQPTSKRRTTFEDVERGLRNRVFNSLSIYNIIRTEAEKAVEPYKCNEELLESAKSELQEYLDAGYTVREAQCYASKGGMNNTILNQMLRALSKIDIAQADYGRWLLDVEKASEDIWQDVAPHVDAAIKRIAAQRAFGDKSSTSINA